MDQIIHLRNHFKSTKAMIISYHWIEEWNKRPMGHICSSERRVQSNKHICLYQYIQTWIRFTQGCLEWDDKPHTNNKQKNPRKFSAKFAWYWSSGSGENENVKSLWQWLRTTDKSSLEHVILWFLYISPYDIHVYNKLYTNSGIYQYVKIC